MLFRSTEDFLRNFGVNSKKDLPNISPVQLEDFKAEIEDELQVKVEV